jgi:Ca2+-binding RTX toxin-like protein
MPRAQTAARVGLVAAALVLSFGIAITATNVIPASRAGSTISGPPTANQLKPAACAALNLATIVVGGGAVNGTGGADLMIGSPGNDTMAGRGGADCILGGAGNDSLRGDGGTDVCIGGPGTDTFHATCETRIQ